MLRRDPSLGRLNSLDFFRGLIMVIMAVDHVSYFVAKNHYYEFWGIAPPRFPDAVSFFTRFITQICAPGFFFMMGAGMVLLWNSRQRLEWTESRITRFFLIRGLILILLQFNLENPAWLIGMFSDKSQSLSSMAIPGGGEKVFFHFGVLYALGMSMIIWALLRRFRTSIILAISIASLLLTQILTPTAENAERLYSPILRMLLIPGRTGVMQVLYPIVPWLGFTGLGIVFAKKLASDRKRILRWSLWGGLTSLLLFGIVRALGSFGNFHAPQDSNVISFLNVTKYPPSLTFILLTFGLNGLLLFFSAKFETGLEKRTKPLLVFGQTALFFYITHLYLFAFIGFAFPTGAGYGLLWGIWAGGVAILYPLCRLYRRFKREKSPNSIWRFF
jgi:uncharacterized membrane protein